MSAIQNALSDLMFRIPIDILNAAFNDPSDEGWRMAPVTLEEQILSKVIRPRVFKDANLVSGTMAYLPLEKAFERYSDNYTKIFEIPADGIGGRNIMSVLSVYRYNPNYIRNVGTAYATNNDLISAGARLMASHQNFIAVSTARVQLSGNNTIIVRDMGYISTIAIARCILGYDPDMTSLNPRSWPVFSNLVTLAVKAYIYNTMVMKMGSSYLMGGQELGVFKEIIDEYRDAEEQYQEYLREVFRKTGFMNDERSYNEFLRMQINPGL